MARSKCHFPGVMLFVAWTVLAHSWFVAAVWASSAITVCSAGTFLWIGRKKQEDSYSSMQQFFAVTGICWLAGLSAIVFVRPDLITVISAKPVTRFQRWFMDTLVDMPILGLLSSLGFPVVMFAMYRIRLARSQ